MATTWNDDPVRRADGSGEAVDHRLLGEVATTRDGVVVALGGAKPRALLGLLLLDPGRVVALDRLVDAVWAGRPPAQAEVSVRGYVSKLRRALAPDDPDSAIVWRDGGYVVAATRDQVDLHRFEAAVDAGLVALRAERWDDAFDALGRADREWGGPPFGALADLMPVDDVVGRLNARRAEATEALLRVRLARGEHAAALPDLAAAVAADPLREGTQALHALALYRLGRPVEALRALDAARRALADEVGVEPGPELRDLEAAVLAHDPVLAWTPPAPTSTSTSTGATRSSPGVDSGPRLVGRDADLERLRSLVAATPPSQGAAIVVGGGPGIGKTALARALVASLDGAVAWGRADEEATVPYGPWREVARDLAVHGVDLPLPSADGPTPDVDPAGVRQRTHLTVVDALRASARPMVVVLDDLQWADEASLSLLAHLATVLDADVPAVVVATVRTPTGETPGLDAALDALARASRSGRLALTGLSAEAVEAWVASARGAPDPELAAAVAERTGGNPLFVREVLTLLDDGGRGPEVVLRDVPPAVGDVLRRRASRLAPSAQRIVSVASVAGRAIDPEVLATVLHVEVDVVLDALEEAVEAGLVTVDPTTGGPAFSHALVTDALAAEVNAVRRARIHAAIARALVAAGATSGPDVVVAAHHAWAGRAAGSGELAVELCRQAAARARTEGAPAEAAVQLERARDALRSGDGAAVVDVLTELGRARVDAGDIDGARDALVEAATRAEQRGDVGAMAAALSAANGDDLWTSLDWPQHDPRLLALAERALALLPVEATAARASLLAATAAQLSYVDAPRAEAMSAVAVDAAEQAGDLLVLGRCLLQRHWSAWRPRGHAVRTDVAERLLALVADGALPSWFTPLAHLTRFTAAYEIGDAEVAWQHLAGARASADPRRTPSADAYVLYAEASRALLQGDLDRAPELVDAVHDAFLRTRRVAAAGTRDGLLLLLGVLAGDTEGALAAAGRFDGTAYEPSMRWMRAWVLAEAGRHDDAVDELAAFDGPVADDWYRLPLLAAALHAAGLAGSVEHVERLLPVVRPLSGMLACAGSGGVVVGPVDLAIARAELVRGDHEAARAALDRATAMVDALGAAPWQQRATTVADALGG